MKLDLQYDLVNQTPASASPVEANFDRIEQHINAELVERDGTIAMRAQLKLVGDPVEPLDAAPKQYIDAVMPVGLIMMFGGAGVPPGGKWAICNGAELQSVDYPALYAVLGTSYGGTAGRFNLPDLTDRFPVGKAPGTKGGSKDAPYVQHHHSIAHNHGLFDSGTDGPGHTHDYNGTTGTESALHTHNGPNNSAFVVQGAGGGSHTTVGAPTDLLTGATTNTQNEFHTHTFAGNTGNESNLHKHQIDMPNYTGNSGTTIGPNNEPAVAITDKNLPPFCGVTFVIRVS